jgi:hypothetical protein
LLPDLVGGKRKRFLACVVGGMRKACFQNLVDPGLS